MSSNDVSNKCRTCLSATNIYHQLYDCVEESYKILEMLDAIVPQIDYKTSTIQFSTIVCDDCVEKLLIGYKFQLVCIESNKKLQDLLGLNVFEVTEPKLETIDDPLTEVDNFEMKKELNEEEFKSEIQEEAVLQAEESKDELECETGDDGGGGGSGTDSSDEQLLVLSKSSSKKDIKIPKQNQLKGSYSCSKCSKVLSSIKRLNRHMAGHEKQSKFICEICSISFTTKKCLKSHMLSHTNIDDSLNNSDLEENFNKKYKTSENNDNEDAKDCYDMKNLQTFQCPECSKVFERKNSLASHIKVHKKRDDNEMANDYENKEITNESITKKEMETTTQIAKENEEDNYDKDADWLSNDNEETDSVSDKDMLSKPSIKETDIVVDFIDTGIGEIEKPNTNHKRKGNFPCEICGKLYDRRSTLKRHSLVHSAERPYACKMCTYRFVSLNGLKTHEHLHKENTEDEVKKPKTNPEGFKCEYCPRRFEKKSSLNAHRNLHTRKNNDIIYPCMHCEQKFQMVKSLIEHIENIHSEIEKHKCDQCDKIFVLHAHLVEHLNRHKGNTNLVCVICEKEFSYNYVLLEHMRTHSDDSPYLCNQCGKSFRSFTTLYMHLERHANLKKYQCPECPSRFNCRSDVLKHSSVHLKVKPHICDICGTGFARRYSLRHHKLIHTGEKNFKCEECNVSFVTNNHLQRHMRIHTGERPFKCKYCERAYFSGGDLKKHLRSHLGKNIYICDECPMSFKYRAELREHKTEHFKNAQKLSKDIQKQNAEQNLQEQHIEMQL